MPVGDAEDLVSRLRAAADGTVLELVTENQGEEDGGYINVTFAAPDHVAGWMQLRALYDDSKAGRQLAVSTIVVCEGERSWDDYLLLHHFDPGEKLDDVYGVPTSSTT